MRKLNLLSFTISNDFYSEECCELDMNGDFTAWKNSHDI